MKKFLDLGLQPLANSYLDKRDLNKKVVDEMKKILNLNGIVEFVNLGSLPNDGKVIDDVRDFGD